MITVDASSIDYLCIIEAIQEEPIASLPIAVAIASLALGQPIMFAFTGEKGDGKISSFFQRSTQSPSKLLQNESPTPTPSTSFEMIDMIKKGRKTLKQYVQSGDGFVYLWLRRADYDEMMLIETIDDQIDFVENNACYTGREMFGIQLTTRFGSHCNPKNVSSSFDQFLNAELYNGEHFVCLY